MEVLGFAIAIFLGALIGLQREHHQQHTHIYKFAGIRTFILISLMGALLGFLSNDFFHSKTIILIGFITIILLAILSYLFTYFKYKDTTATTEVSAIFTFLLGVMTVIGYLKEAIILGAVIAIFLTFKQDFHKFAFKIKTKELFAVAEFALIALVVLPLLPRKSFSPLDIPILNKILLSLGISESVLMQLNVFNPFNMWLMVIFVAGISFAGYLLVKFLGTKKGYGLTGFVGGLVSSTAVNLSMAGESKKYKKLVAPLVVAAIIATSTSFIRVLVEVVVINSSLIPLLIIPIGLMGLSGYLLVMALYFKKEPKQKKVQEIKFEQPFSLWPAIKFGIFFAFIIFIAKLASVLAGPSGLYLASLLGGLADMDAIVLTMSSLSGLGQIANSVAVNAIVIAAATNTIIKAGIAWVLGERKYATYISIISLIILVIGLGSLLII